MLDILKKSLENAKFEDAPPKVEPPVAPHIQGVLGIDPMSPYALPKIKTKYKNITDVINHKSFHAVYPQSYTPVSNYFRTFGYTPYFSPGEDVDYAKGAITIAGMIELTISNQPWKLERDQDIELIMKIAETWLDQVGPYGEHDQSIKSYATKVRLFLDVMEKGRRRMYKRTGRELPARNLMEFIQSLLG